MEKGLSKNQILNELAKSPHGAYMEYVHVAERASREEPEFLAHLIAWNSRHGQIRDSKVALPVISYLHREFPVDLRDNSAAHIAILKPREFLKAQVFARELRGNPAFVSSLQKSLKRLVERYLRAREANFAWWERSVLQHRDSMKGLYAAYHIKPSAIADMILFGRQYPKGSVFEALANLSKMSPEEAAGTIIERRIPFLTAIGALGSKPSPDVALALIQRMSPSELINNSKLLERLGVKTNPALRSAYEQGLKKVSSSRVNTLKATKAVESVEDEGLKEKLRAVQDKQIKASGGIEGDWLVLGDKSGSMSPCIEVARSVASTLAKFVQGEVHLVFFDSLPRYVKASGRSYDQLLADTRFITAGGGTSIGCGFLAAMEKKANIDGIAVISDGGENTPPWFVDVYKAYSQASGKNPAVYFYKLHGGEADVFTGRMQKEGIDVQTFDLGHGHEVDYYSIPNLVQTMRVNRYSLIDQIMETPLLELDQILAPLKEKVHA